MADATGNWSSNPAVNVVEKSNELCLNGRVAFVQDAGSAGYLLVACQQDGATSQVLVPTSAEGVSVHPMTCFDLTSRLGEATFNSVLLSSSAVVGELSTASVAVERQLEVAALLTALDSVGAMDRLVEMTVQYSKDRFAFGRPIGAFQSIKHLIANLSLLVQEGKVMCAAAADAIAECATFAPQVVSMAKAVVSDNSFDVAQGCLQVHGGIGFAWEHDLHLYLRRLAGNSVLYGDGDFHRRRICDIYDF
jgi:alkylation response protein AidB-like acyl-CoA dehydrogenase